LGLNAGAIYSFSKNDKTVSHSSTESEIKALDATIRAVCHVRDVLKFLGYEQFQPTTVYVDNMSMMKLCGTLRSTANTRHINMRIHYLRECINNRQVEIKFAPTDKNVANILTKPLEKELLEKHASCLLTGFKGQPVFGSESVNLAATFNRIPHVSDITEIHLNLLDEETNF